MSCFAERLKLLRESKFLTQQALADGLQFKKSRISMYEVGAREPDFETLETIADYFNVDMDYLLGKSAIQNKFAFDLMSIPGILPFPKMKKVPLLGDIACGEPILATENIEDYINMPDHIDGTFCLRCKGDSMINARIFDGDIVFIRQQDTVDDGEIAAVLIDNEATLKRVYRRENELVLRPENPTCPSYTYTGEALQDVRILGKAVYFLSAVQ